MVICVKVAGAKWSGAGLGVINFLSPILVGGGVGKRCLVRLGGL